MHNRGCNKCVTKVQQMCNKGVTRGVTNVEQMCKTGHGLLNTRPYMSNFRGQN